MDTRALCEAALRDGHRQGRWSSGVAAAGLILLGSGCPNVATMAAGLDSLEALVRECSGVVEGLASVG